MLRAAIGRANLINGFFISASFGGRLGLGCELDDGAGAVLALEELVHHVVVALVGEERRFVLFLTDGVHGLSYGESNTLPS